MTLKINIQSRLKRHSRNIRHSRKGILGWLSPVKLFAVLIVLLPVYPSFGSDGSQGAAPLSEIDKSSILSAYYDTNDGDAAMFGADSGFVKPGTISNDTRDLSGVNTLVRYTVQSGDSFESIANQFQVSVDSIVWANDFSADHILKPKEVISIPPVTGLVYKVQKGDNLDIIAQKFKVDSIDILAQNQLSADVDLQPNQQLIIPGAHQIIVPSTDDTPKKKTDDRALVKAGSKKANQLAAKASKKPANKIASLAVYRRSGGNRFAAGYCTWFVAQHKNVTWGGNANQWISNARAAGVPTGSSPVSGAIVQFGGYGYNRSFGHVGIVVDVQGSEIIIKDMNYAARYQTTIRRVDRSDPSIRGYIYAD